jgi:hypothetical protein
MGILRYFPRNRARLLTLLVFSLTALLSTGAVSASAFVRAADGGLGGWSRPVDGAVVRAFEAPSSVYGPGHRGVDFAAPVGTQVRAAGGGVVSFAGSVADTLHVTVAHDGGLRTSYSFLATVSVRVGQRVARGDIVGTSGGSGTDHDGSVLHFGLRVGDQYVDPMVLFRRGDLSKLVHLVPTQGPAEEQWSSASERHELQTSLRLPLPGNAPNAPSELAADTGGSCGDGVPLVGAALDTVCDVGGWLGDGAGDAVDAGLGYLDAATSVASTALAKLRQPLHDAIASMRALSAQLASAFARTPIGALALDVVEIGRRFVGTVSADCSENAPAADGTGGSRHRVMVVAGINSHGAGSKGPSVALDVQALGYHADEGEVRYFSYAADGGAYTARDTHGPIEVAAARLREQLRGMQRGEPGREVDLVAHSQGGVVVDYFLDHYYHPADASLPPLGNVVTLSSPHRGAPLATAAAKIRSTPAGRRVLDGGEALSSVPPAGSPAVKELAEHSSFMEHLWDQGIPEHFDFTTIGATEDVVVPATQISAPGAVETVVAGDGLNQHSAVVSDPDALRAVRAALEGRAPPCVSLGTALRSAVAPVVISRVERTIGSGVAAALGGIDR